LTGLVIDNNSVTHSYDMRHRSEISIGSREPTACAGPFRLMSVIDRVLVPMNSCQSSVVTHRSPSTVICLYCHQQVICASICPLPR